MYKIKIFVGCIIFLSFNVFSQSVQTDWINRYDGPLNYEDILNAMVLDNAGNVYVTGGSYGIESGHDFVMLKYSASGELLWIRRYNFTGNEIGYDIPAAIAMDSAEFIYVTGYCWELSSSKYVAVTIKYDSNGDTVWTRKYGGEGSNLDWVQPPLFVNTDKENNIYITGTVDTDPNSILIANVIFTVKYNSDGDTLWTRLYHNPNSYLDVAYAMLIDNDGKPLIAGTCQSSFNPTYNNDIQILKYSSNGDTLWTQTYAGPTNKHDIPNAMAVDKNNNIYITGSSLNTQLYNELVTIKFDKYLNQQWVSIYAGTTYRQDEGKAIAVDTDGFVYVTGSSFETGTYDDIITIKYNASTGDTVWIKKYSGSGNYFDSGNAIALDDQGNIYVTGFEYASASGNDIITIKYDQDGNQKWIQKNNLPGEDKAKAISIGKNKDVYLAGQSSTGTTYVDFIVIKYLQDQTGVEEEYTNHPNNFYLYQNYPNPFNPSTRIKWQSTVGSHQTIKVFDVLGNEVAKLIDEYKPAGRYEVEFNANNFPSSVYFYQLKAGMDISTKKMIFLR